MSLPKSGKSPITDTVDKLANAETDETKSNSDKKPVIKDDKVSSTAGKTQENFAENQQAETTSRPEFKTPETVRISKSSNRKSAIRKRKTDRKSLDYVKKSLKFDEANEISNDTKVEAPITPERHQDAPPFKQPKKKKVERKSLAGVDDVIKNYNREDDEKK